MVLKFPFKLTNKQWIQIVTVLGILFSIWMAVYIKTNPSVFAVGGSFQSFLNELGVFGPILFICIQIIQVLYPVIPGGLTCVVGHVLFGPLMGFVYNTTGIFIGSVMAFLLARRYGEVFVKSFVSDHVYDKYIVFFVPILSTKLPKIGLPIPLNIANTESNIVAVSLFNPTVSCA